MRRGERVRRTCEECSAVRYPRREDVAGCHFLCDACYYVAGQGRITVGL